jgi:hypothetical protein
MQLAGLHSADFLQQLCMTSTEMQLVCLVSLWAGTACGVQLCHIMWRHKQTGGEQCKCCHWSVRSKSSTAAAAAGGRACAALKAGLEAVLCPSAAALQGQRRQQQQPQQLLWGCECGAAQGQLADALNEQLLHANV